MNAAVTRSSVPTAAEARIAGSARLTSRRAPASVVKVEEPVKAMAMKDVMATTRSAVPSASSTPIGIRNTTAAAQSAPTVAPFTTNAREGSHGRSRGTRRPPASSAPRKGRKSTARCRGDGPVGDPEPRCAFPLVRGDARGTQLWQDQVAVLDDAREPRGVDTAHELL